jgi:hypothetical protein
MSKITFPNTNTTVQSDGIGIYFPSIDGTGDVVCSQTLTPDNDYKFSCILPAQTDKEQAVPIQGDTCIITRGTTNKCLFPSVVPPGQAQTCEGTINVSTDPSGNVSYACTNIITNINPISMSEP